MSQSKKFIVTSQENITGSPGAMEAEKGMNSSQTQAAISAVVTVVVTDMDGNVKQNRPSRFRTERARMDSTSSMSTDDEQDPTVKAMEESSYVDSITSTSSTGSTKPLLSSVKELEEVLEDELEDRLARSNTMKGLLENPSYIDSLTTSSPDHRRLARACRKALALRQKQEARREKTLAKFLADKDEKTGLSKALTTIPEQGQVKKGTYVKNVVLLSIGAMLSYTAFLSLRNLQSSLNHQKGVGLISLAGGYSMFMMGSLISPFVVKALRPKRAILLAILMQVLYVAVNMYPSFYTLVPSTMVVGMCNAFLWVAVNTYLTYLSADYAKLSGKPLGSVMSSFFGIYFMVFQMNNIFGNLLSSLILFSGQSWKEISSGGTSNGTFSSNSSSGETIVGFGSSSGNLSSAYSVFNGESSFSPDMSPFMSNLSSEIYSNDSSSFIFDPVKHCGANHCHSFPIDQASGNKVTDLLRYILMAALGTFAIFGFLTIFCFVEALKTYKTKLQCGQAVKEIKAVFSVMKEGKFLLLLPLQVYMGLEMSFLPGDILKAFVTCPVGIQMVGYVMVAYGASTALSSYVSGRLHKVVGRLVLICSAGLINVAMFTALYVVRTREGDWLPILLTVISWGVGDGVWNTQVNSCIATMFVKKSEPALAANRFASGFGVTLSYAYAPFLCMKTKIITTGSLCIVGVTCFVVLDLLQRRSRKNFKVTEV